MKNRIIDAIESRHSGERLLKMEGYDSAIIGLFYDEEGLPHVAYSLKRLAEILVKRDGMTMQDAMEYLDFNNEPAKLYPGAVVTIDDNL